MISVAQTYAQASRGREKRIQAEADAATLSKEIAGLDEDISVWEGDKKASTEARCASTEGLTEVSVDELT